MPDDNAPTSSVEDSRASTAINAQPDRAAIARALSLLVQAARVSPPLRQAVATVEAALSAEDVETPFVLERTENPHPRMLRAALSARERVAANGSGSDVIYWHGYIDAMADATGETTEAIEAWMDRNA